MAAGRGQLQRPLRRLLPLDVGEVGTGPGLADIKGQETAKRALELAEGLAGFPQETMLSDRRAAIVGSAMDLEAGLAYEAEAGREVIEVAIRGAGRFADGAGRGGEGAGA